METFKTALVVVLLLAVIYGAYTVWNNDNNIPDFARQWEQNGDGSLDIEMGQPANAPGGVYAPEPLPGDVRFLGVIREGYVAGGLRAPEDGYYVLYSLATQEVHGSYPVDGVSSPGDSNAPIDESGEERG